MKFKNSYILLIAMAIFLLVSIGSVCASDNVTADSDNQLASTDADVELTDDNTDSGSSAQDTINTTVTASGKAKYDSDEDKNITVTVKDNETKDVEVNQSELSIYEGNTSINFVYNNSIVKISDTLSEGIHNLTINYLGNANYTNSSTKFQLNITGEKILDADDEAIRDGDTIEIKGITLHDGVEYIELTKDNFKVTLTYINATGNKTSVDIADFSYNNGTLTFTSDKKWVAAGVTLNYTGAANNVTSLIYISTKVEATSNGTVRDTEDKNITVKVLGSDNVELNVTENDFKIMVDSTYTEFTYNNSVITIPELAIGKHTITIIYLGNSTYYGNSTNVTLNVNGNLTINPNDIATIDSDKNAVITLNLTDGVELKAIEENKLNITLNYSNKTGNYTEVIENPTINGQDITFKVDKAFDKAYVTIKYAAETNLTANVTIKVETTIKCEDVIVKSDSEVINFTANVTASDGKALNVTSDNFKVYNGDKLVNSTYNNSAITITDKLTYGNYNLTIKFIGDDTYNTVTKDIVLKVYGIKINTTTANVNSTKKGEVKLNITDGVTDFDFTKDDLNITVSYKDGNNTVNVTVKEWSVENGTIFFELDEANFTTATMTIVYNKTAVANATLNRVYNINITAVNVVVDFQDGNLTFNITDIDTGKPLANKTVSISINKNGTTCYFITKSGSSYSINTYKVVTTDENGIASLENKGFYPGFVISDNLYAPAGDDYKITVSGSGGTNGTFSTNMTINKIDVNIVLETFNEYYGTSKKVTITVTNAKTGKTVSGVYVYLNITGATLASPRQVTDENGTIQLGVSGLPTGSYSMSFKSNDTNLNDVSSSGKFNINKIPLVITGKDVTIYYNSGVTYTLKVTKDGKGVSGVYVFVRLYKTSSTYEDYLFLTNSNGQVSFSASLDVGSHKIIATLADTRYEASQMTKTIKVVKATAKIKAKKVKAYYKGGKYFTIKLINKKTKTAIYNAKVNIKVFVTSTKYYNYNGNTGANGKIKLSLDTLKPGKYVVVVSGASSKNYNAKAVTSKIVIKKAPTKLSPKKLTAKKGKNKYFKVTVKNKKTKKVIPKVKIKVKVYTGKKYKTYTLKTNAKGIAKLNVKKLKAGKHKVIVTSANKYCVAKKAKSTIKIKK